MPGRVRRTRRHGGPHHAHAPRAPAHSGCAPGRGRAGSADAPARRPRRPATDRSPAPVRPGRQRGEPVDRRRHVQRPAGRLHLDRLGPGPQGLRQLDHRLRGQRHRLPGPRPADRRRRLPCPLGSRPTAATTPTCRSWPVAPPSPTSCRSAASWSATCGCPARRWPRSSPGGITNWNDPAITADNNGRKLPQPADHPGRALRGIRLDRAVHPVPRQPVPRHLARLHPATPVRPSTSPRARTWSPRPAPTAS